MAVLIGKHLNLHMPGLEHVFFDQHACIAKRRQRFTLSRSQCFGQLAFVVHHFHALAATPGGGFKQDRVADVLGCGAKGLQILRLAVITRHQRHPGHFHQGLGGGFTAHGINGRGGRAEEDQACLFNRPGKPGVFRQKAIAGVDRLRAAGLGRGNDLVDLQVAVGRLAAPQVHALVGFSAVACVAVGVAVHGDAGQAQGLGSAHHPAGNFTTVGHQHGGKGRGVHGRGSCCVESICQLGARFCRNARRPSWPSGLTRMRAIAFSQ